LAIPYTSRRAFFVGSREFDHHGSPFYGLPVLFQSLSVACADAAEKNAPPGAGKLLRRKRSRRRSAGCRAFDPFIPRTLSEGNRTVLTRRNEFVDRHQITLDEGDLEI
jgi:hypothetical protein